jgi:hypothetical protein
MAKPGNYVEKDACQRTFRTNLFYKPSAYKKMVALKELPFFIFMWLLQKLQRPIIKK